MAHYEHTPGLSPSWSPCGAPSCPSSGERTRDPDSRFGVAGGPASRSSRAVVGRFCRGAPWVRWGSFSVYGVRLRLLCATNQVPLPYELTAATVAEVYQKLLADRCVPQSRLGPESS